MADLNKIQRSKDRLVEVLHYLMYRSADDERTNMFINDLEKSIKIIDNKIEDFKQREPVEN
jgi:hypothetical protein